VIAVATTAATIDGSSPAATLALMLAPTRARAAA